MRHISLAIALALLGSGCGVPQVLEPAAPDPSSLPGVLRVVCRENDTIVKAPRVRTHRDGVHFLFINRAGMDEFWMRSVESPDDGNHGGFLRDRRQRDVASHEPGRMWVACFERDDHLPYYEYDAPFAEFEIVDAAGLWIPWEVACDDPEALDRKPVKGLRTAEDAEQWIRANYDIPPDATRVRPGYPRTQWKGNPWVLRLDGETIVYFHLYRETPNGVWRLTADICT